MKLRLALESDLVAVAELAQGAGLTVDGQKLLGHPDAELWVLASDEGEVLALLAAMNLAGEVEIEDIAVATKHWRQGLGRILLAGYLRHLEQRGVVRVLLEVAADNVAALGLYDSAGFVRVGRRPGYYATGQDAVLMDCCLCRPK